MNIKQKYQQLKLWINNKEGFWTKHINQHLIYLRNFLKNSPAWLGFWTILSGFLIFPGYYWKVDFLKELGFIILGGVVIYLIFEKQKEDDENTKVNILIDSYFKQIFLNYHWFQISLSEIEKDFHIQFSASNDNRNIAEMMVDSINRDKFNIIDLEKLDQIRVLMEKSQNNRKNFIAFLRRISNHKPSLLTKSISSIKEDTEITYNQLISYLEAISNVINNHHITKDRLILRSILKYISSPDSQIIDNIIKGTLSAPFYTDFKDNRSNLKVSIFFILEQKEIVNNLKLYL